MVRSVQLFGVIATAALASSLVVVGQADEPVPYEIVDENSIPTSLTGAPGDADNGREVFINRKLGNCLGCHAVTDLAGEPFHGEVGPPLDGVADRYEEGEIRLRVVNAKIANPDTMMPGFYVTEGLHRVAEDLQDKTIVFARAALPEAEAAMAAILGDRTAEEGRISIDLPEVAEDSCDRRNERRLGVYRGARGQGHDRRLRRPGGFEVLAAPALSRPPPILSAYPSGGWAGEGWCRSQTT